MQGENPASSDNRAFEDPEDVVGKDAPQSSRVDESWFVVDAGRQAGPIPPYGARDGWSSLGHTGTRTRIQLPDTSHTQ